MKRRWVWRLAAVLLALGVWQAVAMILNQKLLLVTPVKVAERFVVLLFEGETWATIGFTLTRIASGFLLAFFFGTVLALLAGRFPLVETLLWPYVSAMKAVPVASFIIVALIWLSGKELSVFVAFLIVFPVIYQNVLQGIKSTDAKLLEMAKLYQLSFPRRFLYITVPQVQPYLLSACSVGLGLSWKAGTAAEVVGVVTRSIGERLYDAKVYYDTADLFAWTIIIVLLSAAFEKLFLYLIKTVFAAVEKR